MYWADPNSLYSSNGKPLKKDPSESHFRPVDRPVAPTDAQWACFWRGEPHCDFRPVNKGNTAHVVSFVRLLFIREIPEVDLQLKPNSR